MVFMTTQCSHKIYVKGRSVGVTEWMEKPLKAESVLDVLHRLLAKDRIASPALVG